MHGRVLGLASLFALLCGGCSGCGGGSSPVDSRARDRAPVSDRLSAEQPIEARPDFFPIQACGGSRTLNPEQIPRRKGWDCGKGCRQVSFGKGGDVFVGYEARGDLVVYPGDSNLAAKVYLVDLASDTEWLVRLPMAWDRPGCRVVTTDGQRLAYRCTIWPAGSHSLVAPLQVYDPKTRIETDLECVQMTAPDCGLPRMVALGSMGLAADLSTTSVVNPDIRFHRFADSSFDAVDRGYDIQDLRLSGSRMVWSEVAGSYKPRQVVSCDTTTSCKRTPLDPYASNQWGARIRGDKVVWVDTRNRNPNDPPYDGNLDIYLHDFSTGKTVPVSTHPARQDLPDVSGDWVVWEDYRNNPDPAPTTAYGAKNIDIFAKNMQTGEEFQLTDFDGLEYQPRIDNGRVFFLKTPPDGTPRAVFMIDLKERLGR